MSERVDYVQYQDKCERLTGAFVVWESHIGSHFCPVAAGVGECATGNELLSRLHAALFDLLPEERREALVAVRSWDWEMPY